MIIVYFSIGLGVTVALLSVSVIKYTARKPINGELEKLISIEKILTTQQESANNFLRIHKQQIHAIIQR